MMVKNVSRFGDLDVPLLGREVAHGEVVDVTDEQAALLLAQPDNWEPVAEPRAAKRGSDA